MKTSRECQKFIDAWFPRLIVVPLSSHAVDGVRKEKERLTAAEAWRLNSFILFLSLLSVSAGHDRRRQDHEGVTLVQIVSSPKVPKNLKQFEDEDRQTHNLCLGV